MKAKTSLLTLGLLALVHSGLAAAAPKSTITAQDIAGSYLSAKLAIEGPYYALELKVSPDGKTATFRDANMDTVRPEGDCTAKIQIVQNLAQVELNCKSMGRQQLHLEIDLDGVTPAALKAGTQVRARSEATEMQWLPFQAKQSNRSFFAGAR